MRRGRPRKVQGALCGGARKTHTAALLTGDTQNGATAAAPFCVVYRKPPPGGGLMGQSCRTWDRRRRTTGPQRRTVTLLEKGRPTGRPFSFLDQRPDAWLTAPTSISWS